MKKGVYPVSKAKEKKLSDEFIDSVHFIFLMLSKKTNKATIIDQTDEDDVHERKAISQFTDVITDSII